MKIYLWASILLFISAYSPLFFILVIYDFSITCLVFENPYISWPILVFTILSIPILFLFIKKLPRGNFNPKIIEVKSRSNEYISYVIPYILTFTGIDLGNWQDLAALSLFLFLIFLITHKTRTVFINPILAIAGYNLFDITYQQDKIKEDAILISKIDLAKGKNYYMRAISNHLYLNTNK